MKTTPAKASKGRQRCKNTHFYDASGHKLAAERSKALLVVEGEERWVQLSSAASGGMTLAELEKFSDLGEVWVRTRLDSGDEVDTIVDLGSLHDRRNDRPDTIAGLPSYGRLELSMQSLRESTQGHGINTEAALAELDRVLDRLSFTPHRSHDGWAREQTPFQEAITSSHMAEALTALLNAAPAETLARLERHATDPAERHFMIEALRQFAVDAPYWAHQAKGENPYLAAADVLLAHEGIAPAERGMDDYLLRSDIARGRSGSITAQERKSWEASRRRRVHPAAVEFIAPVPGSALTGHHLSVESADRDRLHNGELNEIPLDRSWAMRRQALDADARAALLGVMESQGRHGVSSNRSTDYEVVASAALFERVMGTKAPRSGTEVGVEKFPVRYVAPRSGGLGPDAETDTVVLRFRKHRSAEEVAWDGEAEFEERHLALPPPFLERDKIPAYRALRQQGESQEKALGHLVTQVDRHVPPPAFTGPILAAARIEAQAHEEIDRRQAHEAERRDHAVRVAHADVVDTLTNAQALATRTAQDVAERQAAAELATQNRTDLAERAARARRRNENLGTTVFDSLDDILMPGSRRVA